MATVPAWSREPGRLRLVAAVLACGGALGCGRAPEPAEGVSPRNLPPPVVAVPSIVPSAAPTLSAAAKPTRTVQTCRATRAFSSLDGEEPLHLPGPYSAFTACDALRALFPDYDEGSQSSTKAGGVVRAAEPFSFELGGRTLLGLSYYAGASAEEAFLCGCCEAAATLALLDASPGGLSVVARTTSPIAHGGLATGVRASHAGLVPTPGVPLLTVEAEHTCGTSPLRRYLHGFVLEGSTLREVLVWRVHGRGMVGPKADVVAVTAEPAIRAGPTAWLDVTFTWRQADCPFDESRADYVCGVGRSVGSETLRYDGTRYVLASPKLELVHFEQ